MQPRGSASHSRCASHRSCSHGAVAAVKSWNHDYAGSAAQELRKKILRRMTLQRNPYAHLAEFTQSSGTGKSRAVYELAKEVFCIPVTIGPLPYGGFSPVGLPAYLWLLEYRSQDEFVKVIQAFLHAVFTEAREVVVDRVLPQVKPDDPDRVKHIIRLFREEMSSGMTFGEHGHFRQRF
ncbi:hypothetical protein PYCCODRAFT_1212734 [Trametes coccinea BRFM310]|uniref:Uncharacterized protein n=1 Tax=Trametes coccinea (strain BRFM310) TaxID=1353009 RepID=A0A1Y2I8B1_TRAC3|nr:hypothetical protein PYCCODRAFT_1212734 [Trametes coccinea BRFM310]